MTHAETAAKVVRTVNAMGYEADPFVGEGYGYSDDMVAAIAAALLACERDAYERAAALADEHEKRSNLYADAQWNRPGGRWSESDSGTAYRLEGEAEAARDLAREYRALSATATTEGTRSGG